MDNSAEKTENTEVIPATEVSEATATEQPSLAEAVQESKDAIETAEPVKRRGRPKKDPNAPAKEKSKKAAEVEKPASVVIPLPPPTYLKSAVNFPFQLAAMKSGWAGWNLTEQEKEENAQILDAVLKRYVPQFGSEHPELFALCFSLGMAIGVRYLAFQEILRVAQAREAAEQGAGDASVSANGPVAGAAGTTRVENAKNVKNKKTDPAVKPASVMSSFLDNGPQAPTI